MQCQIYPAINQLNQIQTKKITVCQKVDQRAGQLSQPHVTNQ